MVLRCCGESPMSSPRPPSGEQLSSSGPSGYSSPTMSGSIGYTGPSGDFRAGVILDRVVEAFMAAQFTTPLEANRFFEMYGAGSAVERPDSPYERFSDYEQLLVRLSQADGAKYQRMHKGTPFGYMSWLSFDLHNYEKALFYLDTGIAEDYKNLPNWIECPGSKLLLLDLDPAIPFFRRTLPEVKRLIERELARFNRLSNQPPMDIDGTWRPFVRKLLLDPTQRTIISALYVFLLEFEDHRRELSLREGATSGSNQPFTVHLFTGGLLFESLLKRRYPYDNGQKNDTLGGVLKTRAFWNDFNLIRAPDSRELTSLNNIHAAIQGSTSEETAFSTAAKLRNTTGHNLVWDDIFATPRQYVDLFQQVVNAILFVISKG
jgi:hypothetical protein